MSYFPGVSQAGAWSTAISGDVLLRVNPGTVIGQLAGTLGVNVIGGSIGGRVSISGDSLNVIQQGVVGVQIVGGQSGGSTGISGDVAVKPTSTTNAGRFPVSGDTGITDGVNRTIFATVKDYTNSNPVAVVLMNPSGDAYIPTPEEPICATIPFRVTSVGTTTLAGPYTGRVIKVSAFSLQAEADTSQCQFGSGASGSVLTHQWLFNTREGVAQAVSPLGGGYIFKTLLNQALVVENAGANFRGSVTFHTGDSM